MRKGDFMNVGIYIRVSTLEQAEGGYSISEQTDRLKLFCEAKGWTVANVYTDPGYTGSNTDRPALTRLIADVKNNRLEMVLVYKLDRLSRSQKDTLYLIEDVFLKNKVEFVSMNENFDTTTPFGRAMIGILSVFAQLEREQIKERMAMGHLGRAKNGYWRGGSGAPIGYDFVDGKLIVNEYEAMQVREIYELFLQGHAMHKIRGIMQEKYTNRYSGWKHTSIIGLILKNITYIGKLRYAGKIYEGAHEPIVDLEIFEAVQTRIKEIQPTLTRSQKTPYMGKHMLSGLLFCGNCGARYFTATVAQKNFGTYFYYKCYSRDGNKEMKKMDGCKNPIYRKDILNQIVIDEILKLSIDPSLIDELSNKNKSMPDNKIEILNKRISEITKQINKLMDLYQYDTFSLNEISSRMDPLKKERDTLEQELEILSSVSPLISVEKAKEIVSSAEQIFSSGDEQRMKVYVNSLINKVIIYADKIEIHWKFIL